VTDVAQQENLNPEQVRRLVEAVNNTVFLRKFNNEPDRLSASEFEPASADAALSRLVTNAEDFAQSVDGGKDMPPPQGLGDVATQDLSSPLPMTRPEVPPLPPPAPMPEPQQKMSAVKTVMRLRKTADDLKMQRIQVQYRFTDEFQKIATSFTHAGGSAQFLAFERDAFYKWGSAAVPYLKLLRASLRLPDAEYDDSFRTKVARVIDDHTPAMNSFAAWFKDGHEIARLAAAEQKTAEYLARGEAMLR
jgi:hypothetical protein